MTLLLSNRDLQGLVSMAEAIGALETGYRDLAAGRGTTRRRIDSFAESRQQDALYMLSSTDAIAPRLGVGVMRVTSHLMHWPTRGGRRRREQVTATKRPAFLGMVILFSTATGLPLAIMPDRGLTVLRVGATNALGARYLARGDSRIVAVLGSGSQAAGQVAGICAEFAVDEVRCYSPSEERRTASSKAWSTTLGVQVRPTNTPAEAMDGADVVLCATNSLEPVFFADWVRPGVFVSSIRPTEVEPDAIDRFDVTVVHTRDALSEQIVAEGIDLPERHGDLTQGGRIMDYGQFPTLTDLVSQRVPGRTSPAQATCFLNTIGSAFQFAVLGALIHERAVERGIGLALPDDALLG